MTKISPLSSVSASTLLSTLLILLGFSSSTTTKISVEAAATSGGDDDHECGTFQSELVASVRNDIFGNDETGWVLEKQQEDDGLTWIEAGGNTLDRRNRLYVDSICLEPDSVYRWTITDSYGDGLYSSNDDVDPISVTVNGEVVLGDDHPRFWDALEVTFVTPSDPTNDDSVLIVTDSPSGSPSGAPSESFGPTATFLPSGTPSVSIVPSSAPSESIVPSGSPTQFPCEGERQSRLTIYVTTDYFYYELTWLLEILDETNDSWIEVESSDLCERYVTFDDTYCLEPDSTYRWTIVDSYGDGIPTDTNPISLVLNDVEIYTEPYEDWLTLEHVFVTPFDPNGGPSIPTAVPIDESSVPTNMPTIFSCDDDQEDVLTVVITTDAEYHQTGWSLDLKNEDTGVFETVAATNDDSFTGAFTTRVDNVCLIKGRSYRWTLTDSGGDGLSICDDTGDECGGYVVRLNDEMIVESGSFLDVVIKEIGPVDCVDETGIHRATDPVDDDLVYETSCVTFRTFARRNGDDYSGCDFPLTDGSGFFHDKCKIVCGSEGNGPCSSA